MPDGLTGSSTLARLGRMKRVAGVVVVIVASAACAGTRNAELRSDLQRRAAFELHCPAGQLNMTELSKFGTGVVSSYGVQGCGQEAVYVLPASGSSVWVRNSQSG